MARQPVPSSISAPWQRANPPEPRLDIVHELPLDQILLGDCVEMMTCVRSAADLIRSAKMEIA